MTLIDEAAAGASPKVAKCLAASVTTRTNGVNACTDGIRRGDAEWIYSAPSRNGLKSRREDLVHRVCAQPMCPAVYMPARTKALATSYVEVGV